MKHWRNEGHDPDYRFSLANERTFLAWIRTALALLAGAVVLHQLASFVGTGWSVEVLCVVFAWLSAVVSIAAYRRWKGNEIAMRHSRALPMSIFLPVIATACALMAGFVLTVFLRQ